MAKRKKVSKEEQEQVKKFFKELRGYNELDTEITEILNLNNEELETELPLLNYDFEEIPKLKYNDEELSILNYNDEDLEMAILNLSNDDLLDLNLSDEELEKELQDILNDKK